MYSLVLTLICLRGKILKDRYNRTKNLETKIVN